MTALIKSLGSAALVIISKSLIQAPIEMRIDYTIKKSPTLLSCGSLDEKVIVLGEKYAP